MRYNNRKTLPEFPVPDKLIHPDTLTAFNGITINADKDSISADIYKGKYRKYGRDYFAVRESLVDIYFGKCAYCEDIDAKPEVEHYRPKKEVKEDPTHPGYYWLCYEWSNLLPSCHYCNTDGGKANQFPISGPRVMSPTIALGIWDKSQINPASSPLIDEKPYLLHPEIDHPDNGTYFRFKPNGEIEGIDSTGRGTLTIQICNLNRQNLLFRRQKMVIDHIVTAIQDALTLFFEERLFDITAFNRILQLIFIRIKENTQPDQPFSLLALFIYNNFDTLIVPLISTPVQSAAISAAFANFKINNTI